MRPSGAGRAGAPDGAERGGREVCGLGLRACAPRTPGLARELPYRASCGDSGAGIPGEEVAVAGGRPAMEEALAPPERPLCESLILWVSVGPGARPVSLRGAGLAFQDSAPKRQAPPRRLPGRGPGRLARALALARTCALWRRL